MRQFHFPYLFIVLISLVFSQKSIGQYTSIFGDSITTFYYLTAYCDVIDLDRFDFINDSLLSGDEYKYAEGLGLFRESENKDKIWWYDPAAETEVLVMDLELLKGDTFYIKELEVIVDSVFVKNGAKVIRFDHIPPHCGYIDSLQFIEGVGPSVGFLYMQTSRDEDTRILRCHTKDQLTTNYVQDIFGGDCDDELVRVNNLTASPFLLYPNPFFDELNLEFEQRGIRHFSILNNIGQLILTETSSEKYVHLKLPNLPLGYYILKVKEGYKYRYEKLLKLN